MRALALRSESPLARAAGPAPMAKQKPDDVPILFCPFCRECFEHEALVVDGTRRCPEHELVLLPFAELPKSLEQIESELPAEDEDLELFDPRFGRGLVFGGAGLLVVSFWLTFVEISSGDQTRAFSGFEAATGRAPNLWTVPFVAAMFVAILLRRRSLAKMRSARLSVAALALAPLGALAYSFFQVMAGAAAESAIPGEPPMTVAVGAAIPVAIAAAALLSYGASRLGIVHAPRSGPPSADPDRRSPIEPDAR